MEDYVYFLVSLHVAYFTAAILVVLIQSDFMFGDCLDQMLAAMPSVVRYFVVSIISSRQMRHENLKQSTIAFFSNLHSLIIQKFDTI